VIGAHRWVQITGAARLQLAHIAPLQQQVDTLTIRQAFDFHHPAFHQAGGPSFRQGLQFRAQHRFSFVVGELLHATPTYTQVQRAGTKKGRRTTSAPRAN